MLKENKRAHQMNWRCVEPPYAISMLCENLLYEQNSHTTEKRENGEKYVLLIELDENTALGSKVPAYSECFVVLFCQHK